MDNKNVGWADTPSARTLFVRPDTISSGAFA